MPVQALSVFSAQNGTRLGGPVGLPAFFGVEGPPTNGLSDPYCESPDLHACETHGKDAAMPTWLMCAHPNCCASH